MDIYPENDKIGNIMQTLNECKPKAKDEFSERLYQNTQRIRVDRRSMSVSICDIAYLYNVSKNDIYIYHDMHKEEILIARRPTWE